LVAKNNFLAIHAFDEATLIVHDFKVFAHDCELVLLPLAVEGEPDRIEIFEDLTLVCVPLYPRLGVEEHHIVGRHRGRQFELLLYAPLSVDDFTKFGHCEHKLDCVVFVVLSYLLNFVLLRQFLQVLLEVAGPLFDWQFRNFKPVRQFV